MTKSVVVLGNARSGTSMAAGLLSIIGVDMHQRHNPGPQNPKGSFEDINFIHVTSKMHQDLTSGKSKQQIKEAWEPRLKEIISKRKDLWGFKSALTHYNLDIVLPLLTNPMIVVVLRNIYHNSKSYVVHKRDNYGQNISLESAMQNVTDSTKVLIHNVNRLQVPKIYVTYEDMKKTPIKEATKIAGFLDVQLTPQMKKAVGQFIMPNYSTLK